MGSKYPRLAYEKKNECNDEPLVHEFENYIDTSFFLTRNKKDCKCTLVANKLCIPGQQIGFEEGIQQSWTFQLDGTGTLVRFYFLPREKISEKGSGGLRMISVLLPNPRSDIYHK